MLAHLKTEYEVICTGTRTLEERNRECFEKAIIIE
jgi:hypothetical protein